MRSSLALLLAFCVAGGVFGGERAASGNDSEDENPFVRFEIIAFGSFPITLFYTNFGFDLETYVAHDFDSIYAPWPFSSDQAPDLTSGERLTRIAVAAGLSVGIAILDRLLLPRALAKRRAAKGLGPSPVPAGPGSPLPSSPPVAEESSDAGAELDSR